MISLLIAAQLSTADPFLEFLFNGGVEDEYRRCVVGTAVLLEGSNDLPHDIAEAADYVCRVKAFNAMKAISQERRDTLKESVKAAAAAMVTISRACKRAGQCEILNAEAERAKKP